VNLLRTRPRPIEEPPAVALDVDALAAAVDAAEPIDGGPPVMLVSRNPPLLLLALPQDAEALPEILARRTFSVALGGRTASCHLHSTADGGETALLIGDVVSLSGSLGGASAARETS
jgi:hypothetical protein